MKLNPICSLRNPQRKKGTRQKVIVTHNPSEIDQNQALTLKFPDLGSNDIIVPGMVNLPFNIELSSKADSNRTLVSNIGRVIVKKLAIKFDGNVILEVDDFDVFVCHRDLWKIKSEKGDAVRQGIISDDGCMANCIKLRTNAKDKNDSSPHDNTIANAYRNKFLTLKWWTVRCPITNQGSETDFVMKLGSMNMKKLLMQWDKHQPQMLHIRLLVSP